MVLGELSPCQVLLRTYSTATSTTSHTPFSPSEIKSYVHWAARRDLNREPCLYKGSACGVHARYSLNQFAARAGQHRHRQAQAPPRRRFTNRCLPALHFGAQPRCRPPAPAAPPAAGEIAAAQKPPHGKHLPPHKGQGRGSPGAAGGNRSASPRERPPGAGTAAAPAGSGRPIPPRWRPEPAAPAGERPPPAPSDRKSVV